MLAMKNVTVTFKRNVLDDLTSVSYTHLRRTVLENQHYSMY